MFGLEGTYLQFEDEIAVQADVIEDQLDVEGLSVYGQWDMAPYEGKAAAQLQEQVAKMRCESPCSISRSFAPSVRVRKSKLYGSLSICSAISEETDLAGSWSVPSLPSRAGGSS